MNSIYKNTTFYDSHIVSESLNSIFSWGSFYYRGTFVISGWPRRHHVFRTQLRWWGKTPQLPRPFPFTCPLKILVSVFFTLCVRPQLLVTASRALLLKQWDWRQAQCTRTWRAIHTVPVASMTFDSTSTLLATGQRRQDSSCLSVSPWSVVFT